MTKSIKAVYLNFTKRPTSKPNIPKEKSYIVVWSLYNNKHFRTYKNYKKNIDLTICILLTGSEITIKITKWHLKLFSCPNRKAKFKV